MALDSATYLVTTEIAMRSGVINSRYRVADGRFVLSNKDLALVRLTSEEYINGLQGVERISDGDAQRLIAENHFQRGLINGETYSREKAEQETPVHEEEQVVKNENNEEEQPANTDEQAEAGIPISEESETKTEAEAPAEEENNNKSNEQENNEEK